MHHHNINTVIHPFRMTPCLLAYFLSLSLAEENEILVERVTLIILMSKKHQKEKSPRDKEETHLGENDLLLRSHQKEMSQQSFSTPSPRSNCFTTQ